MERGLYIAASGMLAEQVRQDQIANDLANASTPSYKPDRAAQSVCGALLLHAFTAAAATPRRLPAPRPSSAPASVIPDLSSSFSVPIGTPSNPFRRSLENRTLPLQNQILTPTHSSCQSLPGGQTPTQTVAIRDACVTADAEAALWRAWRIDRDIAARDRLILTHAPLVKYLASRKIRELPAHCELDDLVSCGLVALIQAVERFDPSRGVAFAQYAAMRITGAIVDELRRNDWASRTVRATERAISQAHNHAYSHTGRPATMPELAKQLNLTPDQLDQHLQRLNQSRLLSLNATSSDSADEGAHELIDTLPAPLAGDDPEATALAADQVATIMTAIRSLPASERQVVLLRAVHDIPNVEVGRMLGVSESRVSQIMTSARRRLQRITNQNDPPQLNAA